MHSMYVNESMREELDLFRRTNYHYRFKQGNPHVKCPTLRMKCDFILQYNNALKY